MGTDWTAWLVTAAAALWLGGYAWILLSRRCARLRNGLAVEVTASVLTAGVVTALCLGTWAYDQSRRILVGELVRGLDNVGRTAEGQLDGAVKFAQLKLTNLATPTLLD